VCNFAIANWMRKIWFCSNTQDSMWKPMGSSNLIICICVPQPSYYGDLRYYETLESCIISLRPDFGILQLPIISSPCFSRIASLFVDQGKKKSLTLIASHLKIYMRMNRMHTKCKRALCTLHITKTC
jgi:hypothetical protein